MELLHKIRVSYQEAVKGQSLFMCGIRTGGRKNANTFVLAVTVIRNKDML